MAHEVSRVFAKRETEKSDWSGRIGATTLSITDDGNWVLDGKVLPRKSVEYLMTFSLQSLQDAYAGAESLSDATKRFEAKLAAVIDGTIGMRGGSTVDEFTSIARSMVRAAYKSKYGKDSPEWTEFTGLDDDAADEFLDAKFAANENALRPAVEAEIERRDAERKAKAKVAAKVGVLEL